MKLISEYRRITSNLKSITDEFLYYTKDYLEPDINDRFDELALQLKGRLDLTGFESRFDCYNSDGRILINYIVRRESDLEHYLQMLNLDYRVLEHGYIEVNHEQVEKMFPNWKQTWFNRNKKSIAQDGFRDWLSHTFGVNVWMRKYIGLLYVGFPNVDNDLIGVICDILVEKGLDVRMTTDKDKLVPGLIIRL